MTNVESNTVQPRPTGSIRGRWREQYGDQHVRIAIDPGRLRDNTEFQVDFERRWGPQLGDVGRQDFYLSREGAETLRDALTAALEWTPTERGENGGRRDG